MTLTLGPLYITPGAQEVLTQEDVVAAIRRHMNCDWGDLDEEDKRENDFAVMNGFRVLSSYKSKDGIKFWIITEADRSATTVLLPEEY